MKLKTALVNLTMHKGTSNFLDAPFLSIPILPALFHRLCNKLSNRNIMSLDMLKKI